MGGREWLASCPFRFTWRSGTAVPFNVKWWAPERVLDALGEQRNIKMIGAVWKLIIFTSMVSRIIYRVFQEECEILRECVPYVKLYRYNPKYLYPKLNGYGDNGERKMWTSCISEFYTPTALSRATPPSSHMTCVQSVRWLVLRCTSSTNAIRQYFVAARYASAWNP